MAKIEIEHLEKEFSGHRALTDITLTIEANSIFGFLGPNGAGKTTLIRILTQIFGPDKGSIHLDGKPLCRNDIARFGYLPEERGLYKQMRVGDQLLFLAQLKGVKKNVARQRIEYYLQRFGLSDWSHRKTEELSKGMQQKVQFISTILHQPQILILDEPFSGFDPINANLLKEEILDLQKEGVTIILSTHNMNSAEELCTNFALINRSHLIAQGKINTFKQIHKKGIFRLILADDLPLLPTPIFDVLQSKACFRGNELWIQKIGNCSNAELLSLINSQHEICHFEELLPSMNDIFIDLVNQANQSTLIQPAHE